MKFIDEAKIYAKAGNGGTGIKSFRREKFVPFGGPDGGSGGKGGSVIVIADRNQNTLLDFTHKKKWIAQNGEAGDGNLKDGKDGKDIIINVPVGTQIHKASNNEFIADLVNDKQKLILLKGGRGGKGNAFFKSATKRVPEKFQPGEEGEEEEFIFSLKIIADIGIIGFPNAGKSTLISRLSSAKPKIADYPFTTLTPNLGVVKLNEDQKIILADVPGLIPGAHLGKGLGIKFLKHIERTKALLHLIDPNHIDNEGQNLNPLIQYEMLREELKKYSENLIELPEIVAINKSDTLLPEVREEILKSFNEKQIKIILISAVSGSNIEDLKVNLRELLF